jgi:hypothetical protein
VEYVKEERDMIHSKNVSMIIMNQDSVRGRQWKMHKKSLLPWFILIPERF